MDEIAFAIVVIAFPIFTGITLLFPGLRSFIQYKKKWLAIVISIPLGFLPIIVLALSTHPVFAVVVYYFVGIILNIFKMKKWNRLQIFRKIFAVSTLMTVLYIAPNLILIITNNRIHCDDFHCPNCHTQLQFIAQAQEYYYAENGKFTDRFGELSWKPRMTDRLSYYLSKEPGGIIKCTNNDSKWTIDSYRLCFSYEYLNVSYKRAVNPEIESHTLEKQIAKYGIGANHNNFTAIVIGNIDGDPELDVRIITKNREVIHAQNDKMIGSDKIILDLKLAKIFRYGFTIYPDDSIFPLLFVNSILGVCSCLR